MMAPEFSTKNAFEALGIASTLLDVSDPHGRIALTAILPKQREFRRQKTDNLHQTTIHSYCKK